MITSLRLLDFRCFQTLDLSVPEEGAILIGSNAQGKTSILEAICMLVRLQSPRSHRLSTLTRMHSPGFGIAGNPWHTERQIRLSRDGLTLSNQHERCPNRNDYLRDGGLIVWMGNEDLDLIRGPGEGRRRYLDFIGFQVDPSYRHAWSRYRRALQAKNLLLKDSQPRNSEIASYEEILIEHGTYLTTARAQIIQALNPLTSSAQIAISGKNELLSLEYLPASGPDLRESMRQARERERRTRQSVVGPHRDDLSLRIHGMPAADYASEGQQRTIALALKLAQGDLLTSLGGKFPIYLIDDIFGELDPTRRNALIRCLPKQAQTWITTTHLDWLEQYSDSANLQRFSVQAGTCSPIHT